MKPVRRKRIGITGGIGSGKSMASRFWASFSQLPLIDLDEVCRGLLEKGNGGWLAIRREFGTIFFQHDDQLDRKGLRTAIFSDPQLRHRLNDIMHPLALAEMEAGIERCPEGEVLVDVPLLFEAGWEEYFDHRVVVFAHDAVCCSRIMNRDGISPEEAWRTVHSQVPLNEKVMRADHVINNTGSRAAAMLEIIHLARLLTPGTREA